MSFEHNDKQFAVASFDDSRCDDVAIDECNFELTFGDAELLAFQIGIRVMAGIETPLTSDLEESRVRALLAE